jgi:hypothetical protein
MGRWQPSSLMQVASCAICSADVGEDCEWMDQIGAGHHLDLNG